MSENKDAKPTQPIYAIYTDDSGVVISQQQYAELHGESAESNRCNYDSRHSPPSPSGKKKSKPKPKNQISGKLNNLSKASNVVRKFAQEKFINCSFCDASIKSSNLQKHLKNVHSQKFNRKNSRPTGYMNLEEEHTKCPICKAGIRSDSAEKHFGKKHPKENFMKYANLAQCPLCKHRTQYNVLIVHIQMAHAEKNPKMVMAEYNRELRKRNDEEKIEKEMDQLVSEHEKLQQLHDEPRDAGKYMGFMIRENGKFGSLPLQDDYSDESDAG